MASALITKRLVDAAEASDQDKFLWDRDIVGFGLKVSPTGRKIYVLQFRMGGRGSPTRRYTIGKHGAPWTPDGARKEARLLLEQVRRGVDPILAARERTRERSEHPFDRYLGHFLEQYGKRHWAIRTYKSAESNLRRYVLPHLKARPLASIHRGDVLTMLDGLPPLSPALTRSVFAQTRKLFAWAVERGDLEVTPFTGLKAPPSAGSRSRVLSDGELRMILSASRKIGEIYGAFVRLAKSSSTDEASQSGKKRI